MIRSRPGETAVSPTPSDDDDETPSPVIADDDGKPARPLSWYVDMVVFDVVAHTAFVSSCLSTRLPAPVPTFFRFR